MPRVGPLDVGVAIESLGGIREVVPDNGSRVELDVEAILEAALDLLGLVHEHLLVDARRGELKEEVLRLGQARIGGLESRNVGDRGLRANRRAQDAPDNGDELLNLRDLPVDAEHLLPLGLVGCGDVAANLRAR